MKERIKKICALKGISMNQLEQKLGFGKGYISKLNGKNANTGKLIKIAEELGVSVEYLLGSEDIEWNPETQEIYAKKKEKIVIKNNGMQINEIPRIVSVMTQEAINEEARRKRLLAYYEKILSMEHGEELLKTVSKVNQYDIPRLIQIIEAFTN